MPETATAPAPTPTATPAPSPAASNPMSDSYADLEKMLGAGSPESTEPAQPESAATDAAAPSAEKPSASSKSAAPKDKKPDSSAPTAGAKKPESKPEPESKKPQPAAELRQAYESLKAKHKALEQEHLALKTAPREDPEKKTLAERLAEREKRLSDLETEIKFARYESSEEYKEKYWKPFEDAFGVARSKVASLKITDSEGVAHQATAEDFDKIAQIKDDDQAADLAHEMFGNKAPVVLYHRERVQELNAARLKAIEDFRKLGSEREKQWQEQQSKTTESIGKLWQQANAEAVEKYPQWFKPAEGEEASEENAILEEGFKLADAGFSDNPNLTHEQRVRLHSAIRNRAAGFGRVVFQNRKLEARVAELEEKLKAFEASEPGSGDGAGKQKTEDATTLEAVVSGLDAFAR